MKKKIGCFVCRKNTWADHFEKLVRCTNCGFVRAEDKYFNIKPTKLYDLTYFSGIDYENYSDEKNALLANFKDRIQRIRKFKKSGKLLEIGCAFGYFLSLSEKYFQTTGIDLHASVTKIAKKSTKKSKLITGDFLKKPFKKQSLDIICLFDVIEHLTNPDKYVKKIFSLLKKDGIVVIETGDIEAFLPKLQKSKWRLITPPTHLSYFSKDSLSNILTSAGFDILEVKHVPFYRTLNQTIYRLTRNTLLVKALRGFNFSFPINTYDLVFIIAKKSNL